MNGRAVDSVIRKEKKRSPMQSESTAERRLRLGFFLNRSLALEDAEDTEDAESE